MTVRKPVKKKEEGEKKKEQRSNPKTQVLPQSVQINNDNKETC